MKKRNVLLGTCVALMGAAGSWAQNTVLYQDSFDDGSLSTNANGVGGGALTTSIEAHSWEESGGEAVYVSPGRTYTRRALMYSESAFQSDTGFVLSVAFTTGTIQDSAAHNLSFGLVSAETDLASYAGFNPFQAETGVYSVGANVTPDGGELAQGLNFTDGATVTTLDQSGTKVQFKAGQTCEATIEIGVGGYWCLRIDGEYEASGVLLEEIDLSKSYHVVVYGQDDNGGGKSIQSITLKRGYRPGERAAHLRGGWIGGQLDLESVRHFKTMDSVGTTFTDGASLSAQQLVPHKLMEQIALDAGIEYIVAPTWGDLSRDEPEHDSMLEKIMEIKAAGFKVKTYTNSENFVGPNQPHLQPFVDAWMAWCDTDPEAQAFINSQPFHTGIWNRDTQQYEDASETYPYRKYMFCYAEFILKDHSLRYGEHFAGWIFDDGSTMEQMGDNATSGLIEEQRIYQAYANAVHAGNPEIPIAFNNGRSTVSYASFPFAHAVRFDDFTFGHAFGGNNDHASKEGGQFDRNYLHVQRMTETNGYVHDGGAWEWDDLIVGNFHSKLATTAWKYGPVQAWEEADFLAWNLEALQAGGHMTWGGSHPRTSETLYGWASDLLKALDDHLAANLDPGAPNWARYATILPAAEIGKPYSHTLQNDIDFWDPEGDAVTLSLVGAPAWLSIGEVSPGVWEFSGTPSESEATELAFELRAADASGFEARKVTLSVLNANAVPVADAQDVVLDEDTSSPIALTGSDADGDALSFVIVTPPANGSLSGTAPDLVYTPEADFGGSDHFTFVVNDGRDDSAEATVSITVTPLSDDAPVFSADTIVKPVADLEVAYSASLQGAATDADGDSLSYAKLSGPAWLSIAPDGTLSGTPAEDDKGLNSWSVEVSDGSGRSATATLKVIVGWTGGLIAHWALDDAAGTTVADSAGFGFDATASGTEWVAGVQGSALGFDGSASIVDLPAEAFSTLDEQATISLWILGSSSQPRRDVTFIAEDANGNNVLNLHLPWIRNLVIFDGGNSGTSSTDRTAFTASPVNYKDAWNHWVFTKDATTGEIAFYLNGELVHSASGNTKTMGGIVKATLGGDGDLFYDGLIDSFRVYDVSLDAAEVANLYTSYGYNNLPLAESQNLTTTEDAALPIALLASDVETSALSYRILTPPAHGTLSGEAPNLLYTPDLDFSGTDSFTYVANDGRDDSSEATVSITVEADYDSDGIPDEADPDDDNDGTPDELDAFPKDPTEDADADGDGIGDNADLDDDNDGTPDSSDAFPNDPTENADNDRDGIGDNADPDDDNDGVDDLVDSCPTTPNADQADINGDGYGDVCVDTGSTVDASARLGYNPFVGAGSVIGKGALIGDNALIGENVEIGKDATIGNGFTIADGSSIGEFSWLGNDVFIGSDTQVDRFVILRDGAVLGDEVTIDRFSEFGAGLQVGDRSRIERFTRAGDELAVGEDSYLGRFSCFGDEVTVGDRVETNLFTTVGSGVSIGSDVEMSYFVVIGEGTTIGNGVTIGRFVRIGKNVQISDGAVIRSGSSIADGEVVE
ncbi:Ig-like domain-containing protein [Pelagicoccus sp. SDUM812005]|uniref:Ig-like domain-containing protein n=1 Tax=Pelagicoccus sp. SDUM812005 TaxID=3041257 RepID=UPI002810707A|nr:Ig-like domain-containing protein [Pelagicoccus sp. SDUM812005]MDQ8179583.1 tandem-95 repeat protein [Pelagicoccus sp. SDUM812005]